MIELIDGRNISKQTPEEVQKLLKRDVRSLSPEEMEVMQLIMAEMTGGKTGLLELMNELEFQEPMVDIETWLTDPYHFGKVHNLWPKLIDDMIEMFNGEYYEVILTGSLGWGKTYMAKIAACRVFYEMSCLRNPQKSFGLAPDSLIAFLAISLSEQTARKVIFEDLQGMLTMSPYFNEKFKPKLTQKEIRFPNNVWATPASSTANAGIGSNAIGAIMDESNFLGAMSKEMKASHARHGHVDNAELLYAQVSRRIKSRFNKFGKMPGKLFLVSSKRTTTDFTERRIAEAREDPNVFVREYCLTGDTPIKIPLKGIIAIKDLVGVENFRTVSVDPATGQGVLGKGHSAQRTGVNVPVYKITMEDGSVVKATKEHPFLMNDLTYVELQNLKVGDELFSF
jgi:hypothetical protein